MYQKASLMNKIYKGWKMKVRYFDHSATTKVSREVLDSMLPYFSYEYGNPSSLYSVGREAKRAIEEAREKVAKAINVKSEEIYFTSCGSESDNLAIKGYAKANRKKGKHIITSKIEHPAVLNTCKSLEKEGFEVTYLNVDSKGFINIEELKKSIRNDTILISIMTANNEIGTIEPIKEIGKIAHNNNIVFHTDSVQVIGNMKIDAKEMNIDMLSMSAHKFYGPKGIGALYVKDGIDFERQQDGGHQEKGKRSGTENVAEIVGLGTAIKLADYNLSSYIEKLTKLRKYFFNNMREIIPDYKLNGDENLRLPGHISISFKDVDSQELLAKLDSYGICASGGSACCSGENEPSHVLMAIGLEREYLEGTIRITLGEENSIDDVNYLLNILEKLIGRHK